MKAKFLGWVILLFLAGCLTVAIVCTIRGDSATAVSILESLGVVIVLGLFFLVL